MPKRSALILNGSPAGDSGNTARLCAFARRYLEPQLEVTEVQLAAYRGFADLEAGLRNASCFLFATGTYWDSWGSPLQRFLEEATPTEGSDLWLGKPAAVLVSMHSVGGKGVLSRLQGVLNTFGLMLPPMTGFVYSAANQLALSAPPNAQSDDLWRLSDVEIVCHNLKEAVQGSSAWKSWPVDRAAFEQLWIED